VNSRERRIVFRLEFGSLAGWGHLARSSALAAELRARGWTCSLWTDGDPAAAPDDLLVPFSEVRPVRSGSGDAPWIVVDHYGVRDAELRQLRETAPIAHWLVIDDEARRTLDAADLVLNTRLGLTSAQYGCPRMLLGERYALLRAGLRAPATVPASFAAGQIPVLVMIGGTDPRGLTATIVDALAEVDAQRLLPVVVRSRGLDGGDAVAAALRRFPQHVWLEKLSASELAGWANACQFAVSACGGALYELAYLGLRFVGVVVAENQREMARAVAERWHLPIVDAPGGERAGVVSGLRQLLASPRRERASLGGIDGLGAARVADAVESCPR
jgi:spore coat polysaccharide biosynthesis predicted glycosyltransferase SpsG